MPKGSKRQESRNGGSIELLARRWPRHLQRPLCLVGSSQIGKLREIVGVRTHQIAFHLASGDNRHEIVSDVVRKLASIGIAGSTGVIVRQNIRQPLEGKAGGVVPG